MDCGGQRRCRETSEEAAIVIGAEGEGELSKKGAGRLGSRNSPSLALSGMLAALPWRVSPLVFTSWGSTGLL